MIRRREFITLLGSAAAWPMAVLWPLALHGQQPEPIRRIGVLTTYTEKDKEGQTRFAAFRAELRKLGWTDGHNVSIDIRRTTPDAESLESAAKELVALRPDVIFTHNTPSTASLIQQTRIIPIVFVQVSDPVGSRFVESFPRPGGNVTGFINLEGSIAGKWLELLKEVAPRLNRVALLFNPATSTFAVYLDALKNAALSFGVEAIPAPVRDLPELESVVAAHASKPDGGLIAMPDSFLSVHRAELVSLAARYRLPAAYYFRYFTELGGLLSYGNDVSENFRSAAGYADRILRDAKPSELPVQAPVKFELAINLKTAKALGLTVSNKLLVAADEVIE